MKSIPGMSRCGSPQELVAFKKQREEMEEMKAMMEEMKRESRAQFERSEARYQEFQAYRAQNDAKIDAIDAKIEANKAEIEANKAEIDAKFKVMRTLQDVRVQGQWEAFCAKFFEDFAERGGDTDLVHASFHATSSYLPSILLVPQISKAHAVARGMNLWFDGPERI